MKVAGDVINVRELQALLHSRLANWPALTCLGVGTLWLPFRKHRCLSVVIFARKAIRRVGHSGGNCPKLFTAGRRSRFDLHNAVEALAESCFIQGDIEGDEVNADLSVGSGMETGGEGGARSFGEFSFQPRNVGG